MRLKRLLASTFFLATFLVAFHLLAQQEQADAPFVLNENTRNYDTQHVKLELSFDFPAEKVMGTATLRLVPLQDRFRRLVLHAKTMTFQWIKSGGRRLKFDYDRENGLLFIILPHEYRKGQSVSVSIKYEALPSQGLYFFHPTPDHPEIPYQIWTQGEAESNRYWYPSYDLPDDRFTTEIIAHVPEKLRVISNGVLLNIKKGPGRGQVTYHWRMDKPHAGYLTSLVIGEFTTHTDTVRGTLLNYNMPPGWQDRYDFPFGQTPQMLDFFSDFIVPYPYAKYDQTPVQDFEYGGMENISATTLNRRLLYDERAVPNYSADGLVAHELAHQWFGDLMTCRSWDHIWLNEGFATYFTDLYFERQYGKDEFRMRRLRQDRGYLASLKSQPLDKIKPDSTGVTPVELGGGKAYSRGAAVLHALRFELGDDLFQRAIARYARENYLKDVVSEDLRRAAEEVSGRNLSTFFRQWVYGAGFPEFDVSYTWDPVSKKVTLRVRQTQPQLPAVGLFDVPVNIEIVAGKVKIDRRIRVNRRDQTFTFFSPQKPDMVRFDKGYWLLKKVKFDKSMHELAYQLQYDDDVTGRYLAAEALADKGPAAIALLSRAVKRDPFYAVRIQAIESLKKIGGEGTLAAVMAGTKDRDARVREAAVRALSEYPASEVAGVLQELLEHDGNDYVRGAAAEAIGKLKLPGAFDLLKKAVAWDSHRNIIRRGVFEGFAAMKDTRALPLAREYLQYKYSYGGMHLLDVAIFDYLKAIATEQPEAIDIIAQGLKNPYFRTRFRAANLLAELGATDELPLLRQTLRQERRDRVRQPIKKAIEKLEKVATNAGSIN